MSGDILNLDIEVHREYLTAFAAGAIMALLPCTEDLEDYWIGCRVPDGLEYDLNLWFDTEPVVTVYATKCVPGQKYRTADTQGPSAQLFPKDALKEWAEQARKDGYAPQDDES